MFLDSPLGQETRYVETYSPDLLYPVPRSMAREKTGIREPLPFGGYDIWNGYELSWLSPSGKPEIALLEVLFPSNGELLVESKSFKLYLNSFNQSKFESSEQVQAAITRDLVSALGCQVRVRLLPAHLGMGTRLENFPGICIDELDICTNTYEVHPGFLECGEEKVEEDLHSHLLKANCLATGQPDWGSVFIRYKGRKIIHESLLKYIISFRRHSGFGEHCVEQMFHDIMERCQPESLTVYARFTRRGGLDINPFRSNFEQAVPNGRLIRQ